MTQRIFDTDNEKDMADLWDILPKDVKKISPNYSYNETSLYSDVNFIRIPIGLIKINWHDKTEIHRPFKEATASDIGKLCVFWDYEKDNCHYGLLTDYDGTFYELEEAPSYRHCRRLTKQEIEELC